MTEFRASAILRLVDQFTRPARRIRESLGRIARTENFRNLSRSLRDVRGSLGNVLTAAKSLGRSILFGGGAFGGGLLVGMNRFAQTGDRIAKLARRLDIGVEALQEWRFAADRSGVSVESFDSNLDRFVKRIGEAAQGTGEAAGALSDMGIDLFDSNDQIRSTEDLLMEVLVGINGLETAADRSRAAFRIFGREGLAMVNLAAEGEEGLHALFEEQRRYGQVTAEAAAASENFMDAVTNMKAAIFGLKAAVFEDLLPSVTALMKQMTEWLVVNRELAAPKVVRAVREMGAALSTLGGYAAAAFGVLEWVAAVLGSWVPVLATIALFIVGPFLLAIGKLVVALATAAKAATLLLLANPILAAITAVVAALAVGAYFLIRHWDEVRVFFSDLWDGMLAAFQGFLDFFLGAWFSAEAGVRGFVDSALSDFGRFRPLNLIREAIEAVIGYLADLDLMRLGVDFMASFWRGVQSFVLPDWLASRLGLGPAANTGTRAVSGPAVPVSDAALQAARPGGLGGRGRQTVTIEGRNIPAGARLDISTEAPDIDLDAGLLYGVP